MQQTELSFVFQNRFNLQINKFNCFHELLTFYYILGFFPPKVGGEACTSLCPHPLLFLPQPKLSGPNSCQNLCELGACRQGKTQIRKRINNLIQQQQSPLRCKQIKSLPFQQALDFPVTIVMA